MKNAMTALRMLLFLKVFFSFAICGMVISEDFFLKGTTTLHHEFLKVRLATFVFILDVVQLVLQILIGQIYWPVFVEIIFWTGFIIYKNFIISTIIDEFDVSEEEDGDTDEKNEEKNKNDKN